MIRKKIHVSYKFSQEATNQKSKYGEKGQDSESRKLASHTGELSRGTPGSQHWRHRRG